MSFRWTALSLFLFATAALPADLEAGRAKAASVCAACHGVNGSSVADHIPNLAGQRAAYLAAQLTAFKSGTRKNEIMGAIAAQLNADDIANVAAHFSAQVPASGGTKSAFLPNVAMSSAGLPADYKNGFIRYLTQNDAAAKLVKVYYANEKAASAARSGKPLPDGSVIVVENLTAKLDAQHKPVLGSDGFFVPDQLRAYAVMARDAGWGKDIPDMLRNEDWNYAVLGPDGKRRANINQAECLACHKPMQASSFLFTLKDLSAAHAAQAH